MFNSKYVSAIKDRCDERGMDLEQIKRRIKQFQVVQASWCYMNSGTRFHVFPTVGAARNLYEVLDDAAMVQKICGVCDSIGIETQAADLDEMTKIAQYGRQAGVALASLEPNVAGSFEYRFGSLCAREAGIRKQAVDWYVRNIEFARQHDIKVIVNWMGDGTNYPGEDSFRDRKHVLLESYREIYKHLGDDMKLLLEYKPFEPRFYHTDLCDWGAANMYCSKLGDKAQVIVDTGHHLHGANIEHIVSMLLDERRLGGFHFNSKKYADDDLLVAAINPYELYLIMAEIVSAQDDAATKAAADQIMFMIDQNHYMEAKIPTMIKSVVNIQTAYAKALLLDRTALADARLNHDVVKAEAAMTDAFQTDVRPLLAQVREEMGLEPDPAAAYEHSGYEDKIASRG
jgi:L-rhamnose isomerase/sugar isomerase